MAEDNGEAWWMEQEVAFYSEGSPIWGKVYVPKEHQDGERRAAWITASGFTSTADFLGLMPGACQRLNRHGYVALLFDYRGFGKSREAGVTPILDPLKEARDLQNAITYLQTRPEVDETRIGLVGWSFGGGLVSYVAAIDERVAAAVALSGVGDGRRWLKSLHSHAAWKAFLEELAADRKKRVLTGKGRVVPTTHILASEGSKRRDLDEETAKGYHGGDLLLQSAEEIINFRPEDFVHRISPRPILYETWPRNPLVNWEEVLSLYEKTKQPKTLWVLPEDAVRESTYEAWRAMMPAHREHFVFDAVVGWMKRNLSNHVGKEGERLVAPELDVGFESGIQRGTWLK